MLDNRALEGILFLDKPAGMTSHDVVNRLRRKLKMKRIGHAGTLDPMATGLLIMLVGRATKSSQFLISLEKSYAGTFHLGGTTNTFDAEGEITAEAPVPELTEDDVRRHMASFLGDQYQVPPMHSAIKVKGVPLYKMARKGKEVAREPRFVRLVSFELVRLALPEVDFEIACSKGFYVRSLANDFGERVGCGAYLSRLRRTAVGRFELSLAATLDEIEASSLSDIERKLVPVSEVLPSHVL